MAKGVQAMKHAALLQEWSSKIAECRSSGMSVKAVQEEKKRRCNYVDTPKGRKRKSTQYSSKSGFLTTFKPNFS